MAVTVARTCWDRFETSSILASSWASSGWKLQSKKDRNSESATGPWEGPISAHVACRALGSQYLNLPSVRPREGKKGTDSKKKMVRYVYLSIHVPYSIRIDSSPTAGPRIIPPKGVTLSAQILAVTKGYVSYFSSIWPWFIRLRVPWPPPPPHKRPNKEIII